MPSTRLSDSGEALASISAQRHMEPAKLAKLVRGELDWIVMKTLEKDRNRRYETASALAADVQRYLSDEPVQACPPSAVYRLRKFARRSKGILATVGLVVLALVTGTLVSVRQAIRATEAEGLAQTRLQAETEAQNATRDQLHLTQLAEEKATRGLYRALVAQARASRLSRRIGHRSQSLAALAKATEIARERKAPEEDFLELRNETIACLALLDVRVAKEWDGYPAGSTCVDFDGALERYARVDGSGNVSIRRVAGDEEIYRLPSMGPGDADCHFRSDGQFLAVWKFWTDQGAFLGRLQVWKLTGPEPRLVLEEPRGVHDAVAFIPDSQELVVGHVDRSLGLCDLASGKPAKRIPISLDPRVLAVHPSERKLAIAGHTGVQIFDGSSPK